MYTSEGLLDLFGNINRDIYVGILAFNDVDGSL